MQKLVCIGLLSCWLGCFGAEGPADFVVVADLFIVLDGTSTGQVEIPPGGHVTAVHSSWPGQTEWAVRDVEALGSEDEPLFAGASTLEQIELAPQEGGTFQLSWSNLVHSGVLDVRVTIELFEGAEWDGWLPFLDNQ